MEPEDLTVIGHVGDLLVDIYVRSMTHIYILPRCSTPAVMLLNSAGKGAQSQRSRCAILGGILIVPAWRTLAVLKKKKKTYAVHPDGIHYGKLDDKRPLVYWHPGLAQFIRPEKPYERVQVYAFDEPFNRSIAIVYGQVYIGEAHPVQGLNLIEERRYKVIQHMKEQELQRKTYSSNIKKTHRIVLQNNLIEKGTGIPAIDFVAYGQVIDEQRDKKEAVDDPRIPEELKELAIKYQSFDIEPEAPDIIGDFLVKLGQKE